MAKRINAVVGARLPAAMIDYIDYEIEQGRFSSRSDWCRAACREFYEQRKKKDNGGGSVRIDQP